MSRVIHPNPREVESEKFCYMSVSADVRGEKSSIPRHLHRNNLCVCFLFMNVCFREKGRCNGRGGGIGAELSTGTQKKENIFSIYRCFRQDYEKVRQNNGIFYIV